MAFLLAQAGTTLYKVDLSSGTATALTLPTGITLESTRKPKFAILNQWTVLVNSPTRNLVIDPEGIVSPLTPVPPTHAPNVDEGSGTGLTGTYFYAVSFIVKNSDGDLLIESPLSPSSPSITFANQDCALTDIPLSPDSFVTGRRLYRTLTGQTASVDGGTPTLFFHVLDIDDNTTLDINENTADATLSLLPSLPGTLVAPPGTLQGPRLKNVIEWKSRLWAVADDPSLVDTVYVTDTNKVYTWPNNVVAYPSGQDEFGVVAFAKRKNQLAFLKRSGVWIVTGSSGGTGISMNNIAIQQIAWDRGGCIGPETVMTIGNAAFWLGRDGVYQWDDEVGVKNISDERVKPWFTTDTYFNRARFDNAFARYNEITNSYELHLAAAAASTENRWVSYNLNTKSWYGPHQTGALTPTHAGWLVDADGLPLTVVGGSDGVLYTGNSSNKRDGAATAIDMDCYGPWHTGGDPDREHLWLELTMLSKIESSGTMTATPITGGLDASEGTSITHTLTTGRERLVRLGRGRLMRLRLRKNTVNTSATVYGYTIPWHAVGRR